MPSRDSERQAFPDDSFEIFEIRGPGNLCGGDFGCETLSRAFGLVGGVTFARRGREITLRANGVDDDKRLTRVLNITTA